MGGPGQRRRRRRLREGRKHQVCVKLSDDEYARVAAKARVARVSVPAVLAGRALAWDAAEEGKSGAGQRSLSPDEVRAMVVELFAVRRGMSNAGRNINDVAHFAHGTGGELEDNAEVAVAEFRAATQRLDRFLSELQGYLPGVDLSARW